MSSHPTLRDIARAAGVAKSTASLAFSDPGRVSAATRERVLLVASELGYAPNKLAGSLKTGRNYLLGLVVSDMSNPYNSETQAQIQACAYERGHLLIVGTSRDDALVEIELLERFTAMRIGGVLLTSAVHEATHAARLQELRIELVQLDQRVEALEADHVGLDNVLATQCLTKHLIELGHRRIAHVSGRRELWTTERRIEGVVGALAQEGLTLPERYLLDGEFQEEPTYVRCRALLAAPEPPSAIVAANNVSALGALRAIRSHGLRCPEEISLVSVDDLPWSALVEPSLTHVRAPLTRMCRLATERLIDRIERNVPRSAPPLIEMLAPSFHEGNSSAPPIR